MARVFEWVQSFALSLGGPGLFVIAFLDSSFLSFPEVNDLLVILLTTRHPERMPYYATMTTLGSIGGCLALYLLARKGGDAFLRKRVHERHIDSAMELFRRFGLLAVLVPSILPPPTPFKVFVLAAGVARVRLLHFVVAIAVGRGFRYFGQGLLAVWYGEAAAAFLEQNAKPVALAVAAAVAILGVLYLLWQRRRQERERNPNIQLPTPK
ncbi:MAG TPA: VTT domain-containing protein [Vicinamibacterales bacterium]|nr:VTT domain-containing protein [Vicinamibacterales bacterium]